MFDAVIRPACRTKPLPAAGDLPCGAVACGFPSCGSPPTSGHSLRHCCAGRYTAAHAGARAEDAAAHRSISLFLPSLRILARRRRESCCSSTWQSILSLSVICLPPHMPTVWIPSPVRMMSDNRHSSDSQRNHSTQADMGQKRSAPRTCAAPAQEVPKNSTGLPISRKLTNEPLQSVLPVHSTSSAQSRTTS